MTSDNCARLDHSHKVVVRELRELTNHFNQHYARFFPLLAVPSEKESVTLLSEVAACVGRAIESVLLGNGEASYA
ncbi:MAG: hypothetical protein V7L29_31515 [Nostoc sp.]|uniref:hypothetical protein n=1 Tax=Nostoc sp. TaxID=1180 RepID=UPI002FFA4873